MNYDVIVIGAGTSGCYTAYRLARKGHKVLVIEKCAEKDTLTRFDLIHFPIDGFEKHDLPRGQKGDKDYIHEFETTYSRSALDLNEKHNISKTYAAHFHYLFERFKKCAEDAGATFKFNKKFIDFIYEDEKVVGIKLEDGTSITAKLIIDTTGIESIARRQLKSKYMETFEITPLDRFYVLLTYVEWQDKKPTNEVTSWPYYKCWIAPSDSKTGGLIGTGASTSLDYCKKKQQEFLSSVRLKEYTVTKQEWGSTPYTRSPYSFVADNFIAIGDSACLTNPMSGEGMAYAFEFVDMALDTLDSALNSGDCSIDSLWPINYNYHTKVGANNNLVRASIIGAMKMTKSENDFLYQKGIIFRSDDEKEVNMILELIKGVFKGKMSIKSLLAIASSFAKGNKLKKHYENYPSTKEGYISWCNKADILWKKAGKITDLDK